MNYSTCSVCKEHGHDLTKCPELSDPLKPGFYTGGQQGGHDEDDDHLAAQIRSANSRRVSAVSTGLKAALAPSPSAISYQ